MARDRDSSSDQLDPFGDPAVRSIRGMESVVATVSGYHGTERFNLIKLISLAGANYVGALSSSTTHLICWNFEGKKYNLARKLKVTVVNHQWIEDCIRKGKRVSERPYMLKSGQEVGPLVVQAPADCEAIAKKRRVLSDHSNFCNDSISSGRVSASGAGKVSEERWTDSVLLKQKQKEPIHSSAEGKRTSSRRLRSARKENYPSHGDGSSCVAESSHRRRLVKKNTIELPSDSDEDCFVIEPKITSYYKAATASNLDGVVNLERPATEITSDATPPHHQEEINVSLQGVDEIGNQNHPSASTYGSLDSPSATTSVDPEDERHHVNHSVVEIQDTDQNDSAIKPPATATPELSCVICWTDFSSTRGVLPCGHRFCFTCIREWAENMASRKRISTCPLCKTSFMSITVVEDAACSDQKIYSQTIPNAQKDADIYVLPVQHRHNLPSYAVQLYTEPVCTICRYREPADLLISCDVCSVLCIHSYCLDPPLLPWTCPHCIHSYRGR